MKHYFYKGYKIVLIQGFGEKWYTVWFDDQKISEHRNMTTLAHARAYINALVSGAV